jgi:phage baseplate assembly protein W
MPVERVSRDFKDLSMSFQVNPINYDLIALKNETSISRSIRNLVLTYPGEKFFNQGLGSKVSRSLFENMDDISASIVRDEIQRTIQNFEPRVDLIDVVVDPDFDNNSFNVTVEYYIIGIDALPQQLSFTLQPTR